MDELREAWLTKAVARLRPKFEDDPEITLPEKVRVSCGWPSSGGLKETNATIGQCWLPLSAADGVPQVFISPKLSDGVRVLDVLLHELIHACFPEGTGHKTPFKQAAKRLGLEGKATATEAGAELKTELEAIVAALGDYPHAELRKLASGGKKQSTRMLKIHCEAGHDPYVLRGAKKAVELGVPDCPVCGSEMKVDTPEDGEGGDDE
jgi:hypothetical protein